MTVEKINFDNLELYGGWLKVDPAFILLATTQINVLLELEVTIQRFRKYVRSLLNSSYKYTRIFLP
jgi:hypothetical protein